MVDRKQLLADLQRLLKSLEKDLIERSDSSEVPEVGETLRQDYAAAKEAERTAQNYPDWLSDYATQMAAAWVLSCVFARFLEDNELVDPPRIAGPGARLQRARDEYQLFFQQHPKLTDREYLLDIFNRLQKLPAGDGLFGEHNPIRELPNWLSGDAAGELLRFFQKVDASSGALAHNFVDPEWDTRFLGDLYQDLSEAARKKYALLQTPEFVEEFILDRTLDPAIEEFGLDATAVKNEDGDEIAPAGFRMIDPACGSGHFVLGAFRKILDRIGHEMPGLTGRAPALKALECVYGVDLNPYAAAIARFRLVLAAMRACGATRLEGAPNFRPHIYVGDSLRHGTPSGDQLGFGFSRDAYEHSYHGENARDLKRVLQGGRYHAVVANPPYITPKDRAANEAYRRDWTACHMKYSLSVPFLQRIFHLAVSGGYTGQITANSFMKREFGKKLIEQILPRLDLTHVIDTSGAYIPGHGTPTVILFGRNRTAVATTVRAVMSIRGEPYAPDDPAQGFVWSAIREQVDQSGSQSEFVSVGDIPRKAFGRHPWTLGGGGATNLKDVIDAKATSVLGSLAESIGPPSFAGVDDMFFSTLAALRRKRVEAALIRPLCTGDVIRDWQITPEVDCVVPYDRNHGLLPYDPNSRWGRYVWLTRRCSETMVSFNRQTRQELNESWWSWYRWIPSRFRTPLGISFSFVATHNHFALDRGGKVFKQSAPVIKLLANATEDHHLALLSLLNSSLACFWMKQVCHSKGSEGYQSGIKTEHWEKFYEFTGTGLQRFPLTVQKPLLLAQRMDAVIRRLGKCSTDVILNDWNCGEDLQFLLKRAEVEAAALRGQAIALQEELDWKALWCYELLDEDLTCENQPMVNLGERAFEVVLARRMAAGELETTWFERHGSTPITELPADWPKDYRRLVERRIELIESDRNIGLIEQPEYKRRWNTESWESQLSRALKDWLLARLESCFDFDGRMAAGAGEQGSGVGEENGRADQPQNSDRQSPPPLAEIALVSAAKLADVAGRDERFLEVGSIYRDDKAFDVAKLVAELVEAESVPHLPILRYKAEGLRKRAAWEETWALQREEDAIDARTKLPKEDPQFLSEADAAELKREQVGEIPVPAKYKSSDFLKSDYWRLRGKLDVPKERWVSFPHCEGPDGTLMIAWAGYDHLQLARAIGEYYAKVQTEFGGSDDPRLIPLLASLIELLPWLKQWHNEPDPNFQGLRMGDYFEGFVNEESRQMGMTLEEIRGWEPPRRVAGRRKGRS